ncbi:hypothetical protein ACO0QE_004757 [Hanseniaspora vineae]
MPAYDYDDDDFDYSDDGGNSPMNFETERDLDDYLNDEEYDMMGLIFPEVLNYLKTNHYYGYDNLTVKLAIFDNSFNIDDAKMELSEVLKQKKPETAKVVHADVLDITSSTVPKKLSLAEKLKLKREKGLPSSQQQDTQPVSNEQHTSPLSLADKLKLKKAAVSPSENNSASKAIDTPIQQSTQENTTLVNKLQKMSLVERLQNKKAVNQGILQQTKKLNLKNDQEVTQTGDDDELTLNNKKEIQNSKKTKQLSWFESLKNQLSQIGSSNTTKYAQKSHSKVHASLQVSNIIVEIDKTNGTNTKSVSKDKRKTRKRHFNEIFTIYYLNTNIKKLAIENFNKPSPDDIIINAQQSAFESVSKKVADLSIKDGKLEDKMDVDELDESSSKNDKEQVTVIHKYKKVSEPTKPKEKIDVVASIQEYKKHPHISFVVLGHVDAGKSTLMGRLLYDVGAVDTKLIRKLQKESEIIGKSSFHLAWVMDQTSQERERGVTVDICTSNFATEKCSFTIVDAPGHRDFIANAISGISQADVAILCVDCSTDAFESGFNLDGQTKEHAILARSLGLKHIVVAMNKLDTVDWSKQRFNEIKDQLSVFFHMIGLDVPKQVSWVPCSGLNGDGVVKAQWSSPKQNWYTGSSLVQELENVAHAFVNEDENLNTNIQSFETSGEASSPFLFNVLEVIASSKNNECVVSGKIEQGFIQPGETITIYPSEQSCVVDLVYHQQDERSLLKLGIEGDFVYLKLKNANSDDIHSGDLATVVGNELHNSKSFEVQLLTFDMPRPLLPGTPLLIYRGSGEQPANVKKLIKILDKNDPTKVLKKKVKHLGSNQLAVVELEVDSKSQDIPMLTSAQNKNLSKLVVRKEGKTIGAGVVTQLT